MHPVYNLLYCNLMYCNLVAGIMQKMYRSIFNFSNTFIFAF